jgi:hypothetical protein
MSIPKFRKLYFPGLISLVFLPLMCICYFLSTSKFNKYSKLDVVCANEETIIHFLHVRGKAFAENSFRNFVKDTLTGDNVHDEFVLTNFKKKIERLSATADTNQAYSITFGTHSSYNDVVNTIDICESPIDKHYGFILFRNQALIWKASPVKTTYVHAIDDGPTIIDLSHDVLNETPTTYQRMVSKVADIVVASKGLVSFWPSAIAFLLMIAFIIFKKRRYLNLKTFQLVER